MSDDNIELEVCGPGDRKVIVDIVRRERSGPLDRELADGSRVLAKGRRHHFDDARLATSNALLDFLENITRPVNDRGTVGGWIYEDRITVLFELLEIVGMPTKPVTVELPGDE